MINDTQNLLVYTTTVGGTAPTIIEKEYQNFYEFILTSGVRKVVILENTITTSIINQITSNNKSTLQKVYISNNCTSIESECFKDCINLEYISYTNVENNATVLLETISASAFENCSALDECRLFDISNIITNIGNSAFKNCNKLYQVNIQKSLLVSVGTSAFENCSNLVTIIFPDTITTINSNAFSGSSLVNIYFNGSIPQTLGSTIFNNIPENAACYYNGNLISGSNYTNLKNTFPSSGANVVFINTINNSVENNSNNFLNIINNGITQSIVDHATNIINSILMKRNSNTIYDISMSYDPSLNGTTILGYAKWSTGEIGLNSDNDSGSNRYFNNVSTSLNSVVLIHEILHILGFGSGSIWSALSTTNSNWGNHYTGINGIYQYNNLLDINNYKVKLSHIKIEDSGGPGTVSAHIEEGAIPINGTWVPQIRYDENGIIYPSFYEEIMSGWLDATNFFTIQTCGVLQDLGFTVNYNSSDVYSGSLIIYPALTINQTNMQSIGLIQSSVSLANADISFGLRIKCNCNHEQHNDENHIISKCEYIT
jgi:hypothetical protein